MKDQVFSTEQKERIMKYVNQTFTDKEVMFVYYGGSVAYGTFDENTSDLDINVVVSGLKGYMHSCFNDCDLFIYGDDHYLKKQALDIDMPLYYKTYVDEVLALDSTLIYLNPKFQKEYEEYKNIHLETKLKEFLEIFIQYHKNIIDRKPEPAKRLYHILRMRGVLENYKKTGKYTLEVLEPWASLVMTYKKNWKEQEGLTIFNEKILPSLEYLQNFVDQLKGE